MPELKERHLPENCRQGVTELLKDTYGYDHFRNLEIYADLFRSRETLCISQGQLIENVIREAEKAQKREAEPENILLTAPTGSGKSLLFQLPAIYLGKEYNLLTIVVSPLKALIVDQVEACRIWAISVWRMHLPTFRRSRKWKFTGQCVKVKSICFISLLNCCFLMI